MRCIFCLNERESSAEHVFPDAIGGTLIIDRVCKPCNDWLGAKADVCLTDHIGVLMKRHLLALPNRDGKAIGFEDIFTIGRLASDPDQRITHVKDAAGRLVPKLMYKASRTRLDDGSERIQVTLDGSEIDAIPKIIERTRKREKTATFVINRTSNTGRRCDCSNGHYASTRGHLHPGRGPRSLPQGAVQNCL